MALLRSLFPNAAKRRKTEPSTNSDIASELPTTPMQVVGASERTQLLEAQLPTSPRTLQRNGSQNGSGSGGGAVRTSRQSFLHKSAGVYEELCYNVRERRLSAGEMRIVLISDGDHRVLFDSDTVIPISERIVASAKLTPCRQYQLLRHRGDVPSIAQMLFGAMPSASGQDAFKIHTLIEVRKLMISRIFSIPKFSRNRESGSVESDSESANYLTIRSLDGLPLKNGKLVRPSCTDPPERFIRVRQSSLQLDIGSPEDPSTFATLEQLRAFSPPHRLSQTRRIQMAHRTSLCEDGSGTRWKSRSRLSSCSSSADADDWRQVGVALLVPDDYREFFFEHCQLIESELARLEARVQSAALAPSSFIHSVSQAWRIFAENLCVLHNAPRLRHPVWLTLYERRGIVEGRGSVKSAREETSADDVAKIRSRFCNRLATLVRRVDKKETKFFLSNLITAVLMHHMAWVASVAPPDPKNRKKPGSQPEDENHIRAKLPPYNAHMAQYLEVLGSVGASTRMARTVLIGNDENLLAEILSILSYFVRCSAIQRTEESLLVSDLPKTRPFSPSRRSVPTPDSTSSSIPSVEFKSPKRVMLRVGGSRPVPVPPFNAGSSIMSAAPMTPLTPPQAMPPSPVATTAPLATDPSELPTTSASSMATSYNSELNFGSSPEAMEDSFEDLEASRAEIVKSPIPRGIGRSLLAGPSEQFSAHFVISGLLKERDMKMDLAYLKMVEEARAGGETLHHSLSGLISPPHSQSASNSVPSTARSTSRSSTGTSSQLPPAPSSSVSSTNSERDLKESAIVFIIADTSDWSVRVLTGDGNEGDVTAPSEAVVSMLETFASLEEMGQMPAFLLQRMEDDLGAMLTKSLSLLEMLGGFPDSPEKQEKRSKKAGSTQTLSPEQHNASSATLSSASASYSAEKMKEVIDCEHSDLRLLLNVAAVYWPAVLDCLN